jgi:hypothetical protein
MMTSQTNFRPRNYLILYFLGLGVSFAAAWLQPVPGYMDAEYYYAGAIRLQEGQGWTQPFLWNYLDDPVGLPHPSHTYWMPMASLIGAAGMAVTGSSDFLSARLVFILLAALLPPLTAFLSFQINGKGSSALLAGLIALFPGYYLVYTTVTENFTLYMIFGTLFLVVAFMFHNRLHDWIRFPALGILAGFMHLTRADGLLWLMIIPVIVLAWVWSRAQSTIGRRIGSVILLTGLGLVAYAIVMAPWFVRNFQNNGSLLSPGGTRALWLTDYNQTFRYPPEEVNFEHWRSAGWRYHLKSRWDALEMNLKSTLAVQGGVFLLPLMLTGLWRLRRLPVVWFAVFMWLATLGIMTVVFPFAGWRGGFIHSGAALQPFWWALVPIGFDAFLDFGKRHRNWDEVSSRRFFSISLVAMTFLLSAAMFYQKVVGEDPHELAWRAGFDRYLEIETALPAFGIDPTDVLMVNNPPGLYVASRRWSIAVPDGTVENAVAAGQKFGASYLLLDENVPSGLADLYQHPGNRQGLTYLNTISGTHVFRIEQ